MRTWRGLGAAIVGVMWWCAMGGLGGCKEKKQTPEQAVMDQYLRGEEAIAARDATTFRNTLTTDSIVYYEKLLGLACEAPEKEARAMAASELSMVIALRNRVPGPRLKLMTAEDLIIWLIDQGELVVDAELGIYPMHVSKIQGDTAWLQMGEERVVETRRSRRRRGAAGAIAAAAKLAELANKELEPIPGLVYQFKNLNGYWYQDIAATRDSYNDLYKQWANQEGMDIVDFLLVVERDKHGSLDEEAIWRSPK